MIYGSVCSGIEAASVAWHPLGWRPAFFSEIEAFPRAVLKHHYPHVPLHGDFTTIGANDYAAIDVLVGGTPCQSFSIAGLRGGLDDERGNLALEFCLLARRLRPRWVIWENVPGVLSMDRGGAFASILGGLAECGYGLAYRVLDAQFVRVDGFGRAVPQRRRRVFVVGCAGDWRRAAAVLFERESLLGNSPPRRQAGQNPAPTLSARTKGGGGLGTDFDCDGGLIASDVAPCLRAGGNSTGGDRPYGTDADTCDSLLAFGGNNQAGPIDVANAQTAHGGSGRFDFESETFVAVAGTLDTAGNKGGTTQDAFAGRLLPVVFDETQITSAANRSNPAQGDPCHPIPAHGRAPTLAYRTTGNDGCYETGDVTDCLNTGSDPAAITLLEFSGECHACPSQTDSGALLRGVRSALGEEAFAQWGLGILDTLQSPEILRSALHGSELRPAAFSRRWVVYCALSREEDRSAGAVQSLRESFGERCPPQEWQPSQQLARELGAYLSELSQRGAQAERLMHDLWEAAEGVRLLRQALSAVQKVRRPASSEGKSTLTSWQVRRLTVEECEFLQGFPRGYSAVPYRGKPAADGPRYKALGNSMAVNVMRWIGRRIEMMESAP